MKSILDPSFRYTNSVDTDLRKTFARIRRDLRKQINDSPAPHDESGSRVISFRMGPLGSPGSGAGSVQLASIGGSRDDR